MTDQGAPAGATPRVTSKQVDDVLQNDLIYPPAIYDICRDWLDMGDQIARLRADLARLTEENKRLRELANRGWRLAGMPVVESTAVPDGEVRIVEVNEDGDLEVVGAITDIADTTPADVGREGGE